MFWYQIRCINSAVVGMLMRFGSFRFSREYRHGATRFKRIVYGMVNTVAANYVADGDHPLSAVFWGTRIQQRFLRSSTKFGNW